MTNYDDYIHMPKLLAETFTISTSEARRCINQGGVWLNDAPMLDFDLPREWVEGKELRLGKRRVATINAR